MNALLRLLVHSAHPLIGFSKLVATPPGFITRCKREFAQQPGVRLASTAFCPHLLAASTDSATPMMGSANVRLAGAALTA